MNYFFDQEIKAKKGGLPRGRFIVVQGPQGAGKTSLVTTLLRDDYKYHNARRNAAARAHIESLNRLYGYELEMPEHLYFSNVEIALTRNLYDRSAVRTHYVNVQNFGLPNNDYETQYFPWGSVVFIQEADVQLYCQDWQRVSKYVWNLIKYVRQNNMTVIFDLQVYDRLTSQLRPLVTDLIDVDRMLHTGPRFFGLIKERTTWYFVWSLPQQTRAANNRALRGEKAKTLTESEQKLSYRHKGHIFDAYNSYGGEMYFLRGISEHGYTVKEHPAMNYSAEGVKRYCEMIPLQAPKSSEATPERDGNTG